jgi:hypothetical protein
VPHGIGRGVYEMKLAGAHRFQSVGAVSSGMLQIHSDQLEATWARSIEHGSTVDSRT